MLASLGFAWGTKGPESFTGWGATATWPLRTWPVMKQVARAYMGPGAKFYENAIESLYVMARYAKHPKYTKGAGVIQFSTNNGGMGAVQVGGWGRSTSLSWTAGYGLDAINVLDMPGELSQRIQSIKGEVSALAGLGNYSFLATRLHSILGGL